MPKVKDTIKTNVSKSYPTWKKENTGSKKIGEARRKIQNDMPPFLKFVCQNCGHKYEWQFQKKKRREWEKELAGVVCPRCFTK